VKRALITGSSGQDGQLLSKYLLSIGYQVIGLSRQPIPKSNFLPSQKNFIQHIGNFADSKKLHELIKLYIPDEIYNLGGISSVAQSFEIPEETISINGQTVVNTLDFLQSNLKLREIKFFQASSSEMFGKTSAAPQNEATNFHPTSPYGISKVLAHQACQNYRETYGMFVSTGIMYNHESELRPVHFVSRKITHNVSLLVHGKISRFSLGSLDSQRDWGYAGDYVRAMHLSLSHENPDDYVFATGENHSVRDFLTRALSLAHLDEYIEKYVEYDKNETRPNEPTHLVGNPEKAEKLLGWKRTLSFDQLIERMLRYDLSQTLAGE
jgi:GDPmannose 4,6-dehydratase